MTQQQQVRNITGVSGTAVASAVTAVANELESMDTQGDESDGGNTPPPPPVAKRERERRRIFQVVRRRRKRTKRRKKTLPFQPEKVVNTIIAEAATDYENMEELISFYYGDGKHPRIVAAEVLMARFGPDVHVEPSFSQLTKDTITIMTTGTVN